MPPRKEESPATVCPMGQRDVLSTLRERERAVTFARLKGRPYGFDVDGRPITQVKGKLIRAAVEALYDSVAERSREETPLTSTRTGRKHRQEAAKKEALDALVARLNAAIVDPTYRVTPESLLDESRSYSREFELFVNIFCAEISGDRRYFWKRGARSISPSLAALFRPFSLRQIYSLVPKVTARFVETDIRVVESSDSSAVLQWYSNKQQEGLSPELRTEWLEMSCPAFCGAYSSIPSRMEPTAEPSRVTALKCQRQGSPYCEWRFTWSRPHRGWGAEVVAAGGLSLLLTAAAVLFDFPGRIAVALAALLPAGFAFHLVRTRAVRSELERIRRDLDEVRDVAESQDAAFDQARERGQLAEHGLQRANASLAALEEAARALTASTDVDVVHRTVLQSLGRHLLFDRAALLLLDEPRQVLVGAATFGVSPDTTARLKKHEEPASPERSELAKAMHAGAPEVLADEPIRSTSFGAFWLTLSTRELLAAPLLHRGRPVGLLLADNSATGRPFVDEDKKLLASVASLLSSAAEPKKEGREREKTAPHRMVE